MNYKKAHFTDEIGPAALRTAGLLAISVVSLLAMNIEHPKFAKGFDLPLIVILAAAIYINPRVALYSGLAAGFVCDLYAGKLSVLHIAFYSLPGLMGPLLSEGVLFKSGTIAGVFVFIFILIKFLIQYIMLFVFGQGDWVTAFSRVNWWSVLILVGFVMIFWEKLGAWMSAQPESMRFRRGIYGR